MAPYDANFESQLTVYRRRRRLLVAKNIHFKASRTGFKTACRDKLSKPDAVKFFWRPADKPWATHMGWVMVGFETRLDARKAEEELKNFKFSGRDIKIQRASKVAYAPLPSVAPTTATSAAEGSASIPAATAPATTPASAAAGFTTALAIRVKSEINLDDIDGLE